MNSRLRILTYCLLVPLTQAAVPADSLGDAHPEEGPALCKPDPNRSCLQTGRFSAEVLWDDNGTDGLGLAIPVVDDNFAAFYFEDPRYPDLTLYVRDDCASDEGYHVASMGLSDVTQQIFVLDWVVGGKFIWVNPSGNFPTFANGSVFPCPAFDTPRQRAPALGAPEQLPLIGRFNAELEWSDANESGFGQPLRITSHAGAFYFPTLADPALTVKLVEDPAPDSFTVVYSDVSPLAYTLRVTDTCTGSIRTYTAGEGHPLETQTDPAAFTGPGCPVFVDGFESGDTSLWSTTVP